MVRVSNDQLECRIELLRDYFNRDENVLIAFLFGSKTQGMGNKISDWDIAVYLKQPNIKAENKIWLNLVDILNNEVDLIRLDLAPPILASRIVREGIPLKIADRNFYITYFLVVTEAGDYFIQFANDYYRIYQSSKSLSEMDKARLQKIIVFIENSIKEFDEFKKLSFGEYVHIIEKRRNVERWIENMMNSVLDVSKIVLAGVKKPLPDAYRKIFLELSLLVTIDEEMQEKFAEWVALRNILPHESLEILWERIKNFIDNAEPYLTRFMEKLKNITQ